jgi:hypothetical protein
MWKTAIVFAGIVILMLTPACKTSHEIDVKPVQTSHDIEVKPIEIKPIHITIDVNIRVDRALDNFFDEIDKEEEASGKK